MIFQSHLELLKMGTTYIYTSIQDNQKNIIL